MHGCAAQELYTLQVQDAQEAYDGIAAAENTIGRLRVQEASLTVMYRRQIIHLEQVVLPAKDGLLDIMSKDFVDDIIEIDHLNGSIRHLTARISDQDNSIRSLTQIASERAANITAQEAHAASLRRQLSSLQQQLLSTTQQRDNLIQQSRLRDAAHQQALQQALQEKQEAEQEVALLHAIAQMRQLDITLAQVRLMYLPSSAAQLPSRLQGDPPCIPAHDSAHASLESYVNQA